MKTFWSIFKKIILWSYQRGSWQYDLLCILILAFIFLTPSDWFNPEPELPLPEFHQSGSPPVIPSAAPEAVGQRPGQDSKKSPSAVTKP